MVNLFKPYKITKLDTPQDISKLDDLVSNLYKFKQSQESILEKVYDTIIDTSTSNVTIGALNGDLDKFYLLLISLYDETSGTDHEIRLQFNEDVGATQYGYSDQVTVNDSTSSIRIGRSSGQSKSITKVWIQAEHEGPSNRNVLYENYYLNNATDYRGLSNGGGHWRDTTNNMISMQISSAAAAGIGAGTRIQLYTSK